MESYTNYRYQDFCNESFENEFQDDSSDLYQDFTGSRIKSCDFRGANLVGADFSETAIGRDNKNFRMKITEMIAHIILGIPLGLAVWFFSRFVFVGCGGEIATPYGWMTQSPYGWMENPFVWIFAFATAAAMSQRSLFYIYMGLIGLMVVIAAINSTALTMVGIGVMIAAFVMSLFGLYLGYKKGSIAVGMVWMAVVVSSSISAGYSWLKYHEIRIVILFAILALLPAVLATKAFNLHFAKVKMSAMTCFRRADLTNAKFVNAVLENCDFVDAKLEGVDWQGAVFRNCQFSQGWSREFQEANPLVEKLPVN